jgi:cell division protein FtsW
MSDRFTVERVDQSSTDYILLGILFVLIGIGISVLFSSSYFYGSKRFGDPQYFFHNQLIYIAVGTALGFLVSRLPISFIRKMVPGLLLFSLVLLLLTFVPVVGRPVLGARRWIFLGSFSFQPSEFAKLSVILYLASILSKKEERIDDLVNSVVPPLIITILIAAVIYIQNDFSTAIFILFLSLVMFFIAKIRLVYFIFLGVASLFWGVGLGQGTKKLGGLPEAHSDFVFAVLGEEAGFLGVLFICALFILFALRGYMIAFHRKDGFGFLLAFGITTSILFQALFNMAVVAGIIPATGIPLPFFSVLISEEI